MEQQERALGAYIDLVREDPATLAVVLVGSVARGRERPDSDVDVYLVVDDEGFASAASADRFAWVDRWGKDYPGSYIDVKLASPSYLEAAADHGDDPTRASFVGARLAFARPEVTGLIESLIQRITRVPDDSWAHRVRSHVAQARLYGGYFLVQAVQRNDAFLLRHAGLHLALAAARAALAAGGTFLQGPKYVSTLIRAVPTPDGFVDMWDSVVESPNLENARELLRMLDTWLGEEMSADQALSTFIRDNELGWLRGTIPAEFW